MEGILALHKPRGMTSHDCVYKLRKLLKTKKIGHTGTLDPEVNGVLPMCIGEATKIASYLTDYDKEYIGEVTLGYSTTTEDAHGEIVSKKKVTHPINREQIMQVLESFVGNIEQIPPMYSAVKVNGKKLYEYARENIEVERPKREVTVYELALLSEEEQFTGDMIRFSIRVRCSKGTYVRTLAYDIGQKLGYPAHLSDLVRIKSGPFTLEECVPFEEIEQYVQEEKIDELLFPMEKGIAHLPAIVVTEEIEEKVKHGAVLPVIEKMEDCPYAVYNKDKRIIAIYEKHPTKPAYMKPKKVLNHSC